MSGTRREAAAMLVLCALAAGVMVASHLALTDIHHGLEPNLEAEWWVVRAFFVLHAALVVMAGRQAMRLMRPISRRGQDHSLSRSGDEL